MLADEVTHVKMGSDWLRRLTENDPERRERALEFQRSVDKLFSLGGFRGETEENPIQLARKLPRAGRLLRPRRSTRSRRSRCRPRPTYGRCPCGAAPAPVSHTITLTPDAFTLVKFDAAELARARAGHGHHGRGSRTASSIAIEVDEALPARSSRPRPTRRRESGVLVLGRLLRRPEASGGPRARDVADRARRRVPPWPRPPRRRLRGCPGRFRLSERQRAMWDVYADGRLSRQRVHDQRAPAGSTRSGSGAVSTTWPTPSTTGCWQAPTLRGPSSKRPGRIAAADPRPAPKKSLRDPSLRIS